MRPSSSDSEAPPVPPQRAQTPKIPPPRDRSSAKVGQRQASSPTAVAIFDTSVPVYMQTVRETSICPELIPPLRALLAALAADFGADADPELDADDGSPHSAGEEE